MKVQIVPAEPILGDPEWWTEMVERSKANARFRCEECGAFVSDEHAKRTAGWTSNAWTGDEWSGPVCQRGKGCNR